VKFSFASCRSHSVKGNDALFSYPEILSFQTLLKNSQDKVETRNEAISQIHKNLHSKPEDSKNKMIELKIFSKKLRIFWYTKVLSEINELLFAQNRQFRKNLDKKKGDCQKITAHTLKLNN